MTVLDIGANRGGLARHEVREGMLFHVVRADLQAPGGGHVADLGDFADAAAPFRIGSQDIDRAGFHEIVEHPAVVVVLAGRDRSGEHPTQVGERFDLKIGLDRLLEPAQAVLFKKLRHTSKLILLTAY